MRHGQLKAMFILYDLQMLVTADVAFCVKEAV
jgi:hypothetical protein